MDATSALHVVMYHYVRDLERSPYPRIKAMQLDEFRRQLDEIPRVYEMATLESALAFLDGSYRPSRDLCLLTFDDGVKEHWAEVTPLLAERGIQGLFFLITACLEEHRVASVHMNHFLMASLEFETYRQEFVARVLARDPSLAACLDTNSTAAQATYPWDTRDVACFKYFFNFVLEATLRDAVVRELFSEFVGAEETFSAGLYVSWEEARAMQAAGMILGGHSHRHRPLSALGGDALAADLGACRSLLDANLAPQAAWPFCFPYGKRDSFTDASIAELRRLGFVCGFTTVAGANQPGTEPFLIRRIDCKNALREPALTAGR